jgi:hypothetical protein
MLNGDRESQDPDKCQAGDVPSEGDTRSFQSLSSQLPDSGGIQLCQNVKEQSENEHLDDIKVPCKVSEVQAGFLTVVTKDLNIMHCENGTNRRLFSHSP